MKLNGNPHRSCSETSREWFDESLRSNVRRQPDNDDLCDRRGGGTGTFLSEILDFDGVGFAVEPEDRVDGRHCEGFAIHREGGTG